MKAIFYYDGHYLQVAKKIRSYLNSLPSFLTPETVNSPRATGDAVESIIVDKFETFMGDWCQEYSREFGRRAMADVAFTDTQGMYSVVDVKTHREDTSFNMPNLTSVERLSRLYESHRNVFSIIMIKYHIINQIELNVSEVIFSPIEFLNWNCLTIGALGWGQIQIANSKNIIVNDKASRRDWMLTFCYTMEQFYPKEIAKIHDRIEHFEKVRCFWEKQDDLWKE